MGVAGVGLIAGTVFILGEGLVRAAAFMIGLATVPIVMVCYSTQFWISRTVCEVA